MLTVSVPSVCAVVFCARPSGPGSASPLADVAGERGRRSGRSSAPASSVGPSVGAASSASNGRSEVAGAGSSCSARERSGAAGVASPRAASAFGVVASSPAVSAPSASGPGLASARARLRPSAAPLFSMGTGGAGSRAVAVWATPGARFGPAKTGSPLSNVDGAETRIVSARGIDCGSCLRVAPSPSWSPAGIGEDPGVWAAPGGVSAEETIAGRLGRLPFSPERFCSTGVATSGPALVPVLALEGVEDGARGSAWSARSGSVGPGKAVGAPTVAASRGGGPCVVSA